MDLRFFANLKEQRERRERPQEPQVEQPKQQDEQPPAVGREPQVPQEKAA